MSGMYVPALSYHMYIRTGTKYPQAYRYRQSYIRRAGDGTKLSRACRYRHSSLVYHACICRWCAMLMKISKSVTKSLNTTMQLPCNWQALHKHCKLKLTENKVNAVTEHKYALFAPITHSKLKRTTKSITILFLLRSSVTLPQRSTCSSRFPQNKTAHSHLIYQWACSHTDRTRDNIAGGEGVFGTEHHAFRFHSYDTHRWWQNKFVNHVLVVLEKSGDEH